MKRKTVILILLIFAFADYALSQSGAGLGSISGVVLDASRAAVPGASVVVANEAKGIRRNLETNKVPFTERVTGYLTFKLSNIFNRQYNTSRRTDEYSLSGTTLSYIPSYGTGSSTATSPDGTNARRAQVSLRAVF